jgi:hypothetical protein
VTGGYKLDIPPRQRKPTSSLSAFLPEQWLIEYQAGGSWKFFHCIISEKVLKILVMGARKSENLF